MTSGMLSQEEIDALLNGDVDEEKNDNLSDSLTDTEKDTLGEIGNISMGTAATTLFTLLGQKVTITTPKVEVTTVDKLADVYTVPFVAVDVKYKVGLSGANLLILKVEDVKVITDLMMGGDGTNINRDLNEMDLSAISEAMNQMVGSSCTSLSEIFTKKIDIDPPRAFEINFVKDELNLEIFNSNQPIVKISFKMVVGNLIDSEIMQLLPLDFAKKMVNELLNEKIDNNEKQENDNINLENMNLSLQNDYNEVESLADDIYVPTNNTKIDNKIQENNKKPVNVKKIEFQSFETNEKLVYNENIEIIKEVPIEITVELGKTTKRISEVLEYGPGSIIELDKLVGEPLDILANGKYIAKGEVVVIDDNFGIRITDIINPSKRL